MNWLNDLLFRETIAHTILIYSAVIVIGVYLGRIRFFGISLGITFVLFAGIAAGHIGLSANHTVIEFIRDFGLILFVFSIGLQVGPGFFSSFRKGGLQLNLLALAVVLLGGITTIILYFVTEVPMPQLVGIMSGGVTNTPGLGAAQQALEQITPPGTALPEIGLGYAVAYPFGVLGIILTLFIIKKTLRVDVNNELKLFNHYQHPEESLPQKVCIRVKNPGVFGKTIFEITRMMRQEFVISRVLRDNEPILASADTVLHENDVVLVVTQKRLVDDVLMLIGVPSDIDVENVSSRLISRRVLVTNKEIAGKDLGSLRLRTRYNVNITRIYRSGIEFVASPSLRLELGDKITVVGEENSMENVIGELGNSIKRLDEPNLVTIFIGILLGVLFGSIPLKFPGMVRPVSLGLAGGPLIIAILLSKYGYRFSLISYTTPSANLMLRELGIVLFLASVGITAGEKFIPTLVSGEGFIWMGYGAIITLVPLLLVGFYAKIYLKRNYLELCGLLAGSMTDPPALAYSNSLADSEAPSVAYATVYPLVMFLRIFVAQILVLTFIG
ncbi:MAG TPA: putative transporter [Bacteroidales bacterium]|nr:putative transporter [Bacteroidales bacterium]